MPILRNRLLLLATCVAASSPLSAATLNLRPLVEGLSGDVLTLDPANTYVAGQTSIYKNMTIEGNGATINYGSSDYLAVSTGLTATIRNVKANGGDIGFYCNPSTNVTLEGITATGQKLGVVQLAGGTLTVRGSSFANTTSSAFSIEDSNLIAEDTVIQNSPSNYGIQMTGGALTLRRCQLSSFAQGVVALEGSGYMTSPVILEDTTISNTSLFGIVLEGAAQLNISGGGFTNCKYPLELRDGVLATINNMTINSEGVTNPANGIAMRQGCSLTISNSTIRGGLNSIDAQRNSSVTAMNCNLIHCLYSGFIITYDSTLHADGSYITDTGQDGIYVGDPLDPTDNSSAVIRNCVVANAGTNLDANNRTGTGIALQADAYFLVENCSILDSYDVGMVLENSARGDFRGVHIADSRLSGIAFGKCGATKWLGTTVAGHTNSGQAGMTLFDGHGRIDFYQGVIAGNRYGILKSSTSSQVIIRDSLVVDNLSDGFSIIQGSVDTGRTAFLENANFQVLINSASQSYFNACSFVSTSRKGVYTERGVCGTTPSNRTVAQDGFWISPLGYWDQCAGTTPAGRMGCRNIDGASPRSTPAPEAFHSADVFHVPAESLSLTGTPWLRVESPSSTSAVARIGATRRHADYPLLSGVPSNAIDPRPITFCASPDLAAAGDVRVRLVASGTMSRPALGIYDFTGSLIRTISASSVDGSVLTFNGDGAEFATGTWYVVQGEEMPVVAMILGERASNLGSDANGDYIIDAADTLP